MKFHALPENLRRKIKRTRDGCWVWTGCKAIGRMGVEYGKCKFKSITWRVHRLIWTLTHGDIPANFHIDHTCFNTMCCNPEHLRAVHWWDNLAARRCKSAETMTTKGNPYV